MLIILAGAAAHVWYLISDCPYDLAGDEAHYWEWSRRLDWSYYSKGPLVAYIIAAGRLLLSDWSREIVGSEMLAVRLPAVALGVLTSIGIFVLAVRMIGPRAALGAVALTVTMPILAAGSMLMTIDAPLMACWTWGLVFAERAIRTDSLTAWLATGVCIALGILAKYTMVLLLPAVGLAILLEPNWRRLALRPGPYLATIVGFVLGLAPIVIWNAQHDWVSLRHVAGQAGVSGGPSINFAGPFEYLLTQFAVVNPVWFVMMLWAAIDLHHVPRDSYRDDRQRAGVRLLVLAMLMPWLAFLVFSPLTKIQPNWPVTALAAGSCVLAYWLGRRLQTSAPRRNVIRNWTIAGAALGLVFVIVSHQTRWLTPVFVALAGHPQVWELTPVADNDPTTRLRGWADLGAAVGEVLAEERAAGRDPFIITDDYATASEIAFYTPGNPDVYCIQAALGRRRSQYDLWTNPLNNVDEFVGRPCLYIGKLRPELTGQGDEPGALPGLEKVREVEHYVGGHRYRIWTVHHCDAYAGFPETATETNAQY